MKLILITVLLVLTFIAVIAWTIFNRKNKELDKKILELKKRKDERNDLL